MASSSQTLEILNRAESASMLHLPRVRLQANHSLVVVATDSGDPQRQSEGTLVITVTDINDQTPVFEAAKITKVLPEDAPAGKTAAQCIIMRKDWQGPGLSASSSAQEM